MNCEDIKLMIPLIICISIIIAFIYFKIIKKNDDYLMN